MCPDTGDIMAVCRPICMVCLGTTIFISHGASLSFSKIHSSNTFEKTDDKNGWLRIWYGQAHDSLQQFLADEVQSHVYLLYLVQYLKPRSNVLCLGIHGKSSIISIIVPFHSGHMAIDDLPNYKTARRLVEREMVRHYTNKKGEHRICCGKDLKSSQAYPRGFLGTIKLFGNLICPNPVVPVVLVYIKMVAPHWITLQLLRETSGQVPDLCFLKKVLCCFDMIPLQKIKDYLDHPFAYPRFGQGMAKCRTRVLKSHGKMARSFARASQQSANKADTRKRVNSAWTKGAQLESVINFLSH